jgi:hypothetical protein
MEIQAAAPVMSRVASMEKVRQSNKHLAVIVIREEQSKARGK